MRIRIRLTYPDRHLPACRSLRPPSVTVDGATVTVSAYYCAGCLPIPLEVILAELDAAVRIVTGHSKAPPAAAS